MIDNTDFSFPLRPIISTIDKVSPINRVSTLFVKLREYSYIYMIDNKTTLRYLEHVKEICRTNS